jgi:hypothetical protein
MTRSSGSSCRPAGRRWSAIRCPDPLTALRSRPVLRSFRSLRILRSRRGHRGYRRPAIVADHQGPVQERRLAQLRAVQERGALRRVRYPQLLDERPRSSPRESCFGRKAATKNPWECVLEAQGNGNLPKDIRQQLELAAELGDPHVPTRVRRAVIPSWLPLDRAALGLGLRRVGLPSGQHRVERGAKPGRVLRWIVVVGVRSASVAQLQT